VIAALFVERSGVYWNLDGVDAWDEQRDARLYAGPYPVVCHSPCQRWGRYWSGGPSVKVRRALGDDGGCFAHALHCVRTYGGVLEHPEASHAFRAFGLTLPPRIGGWIESNALDLDWPRGWTCCVEQGHYGHPARKATWLYYVGNTPPPELIWGPSQGVRLDEGFHSKAEPASSHASDSARRRTLQRRFRFATC
jgi:hypothetical protein